MDVATLIEETPAFESSHFMLYQNYPNPFSNATQIDVNISVPGNYSLTLYDLMGKEVKKIADNEFLRTGWHTFTLEPGSLKATSNTYYYTLQKGNELQTKKLVFLH